MTDVEAIGSLSAPLSIQTDSADRVITGTGSVVAIAPFTQLTGLIDSSDGVTFRVGLDQKISVYQSLTAAQLQGFYRNIEQIITPNSFTFDDSGQGKDFVGAFGDSAEAAAPDFSLTIETMDNAQFDSSFNS